IKQDNQDEDNNNKIEFTASGSSDHSGHNDKSKDRDSYNGKLR
ncbi:463_t:CDS:1, partial [Funneliformis geosporum]